MKSKGIIIQGSARSDGNTAAVVKSINSFLDFETVDLNQKRIEQFDYSYGNSDDDFIPLAKRIATDYKTLIFATPVYWYSMSGIMKAFFDRITDLLRTEKDVGRQLRGKSMAMISCGSDKDRPDYFELPFVDTANYLGMNYLGSIHTWVEDCKIPDSVVAEMSSFSKILLDSK